MNEAEKERLIKKDIESVENRVRHAFNQGYEMGLKESCSEIPNTCGDAISREAVLDLAEWFSINQQHFIVANLIDEVENMPSVTPQQKIGYWEWVRYDGLMGNWHCSECRTIIPHMPEETDNTPCYKWCPMCGAKMEVDK